MTPEGFSDGLRRLLLPLELHPLAPWPSFWLGASQLMQFTAGESGFLHMYFTANRMA